MTGPHRAPARLRAVTWNVRTCRRREDERGDLDLTVATLRVRRAWIAAGPVSDHRAAVVDLEVSQAEGRSNQA